MVNFNKNIFIDLISKSQIPEKISLNSTQELLKKYPAFHSLQLTNAIALKINEPTLLDKELTTIATNVIDRTKLHDAVHQKNISLITEKEQSSVYNSLDFKEGKIVAKIKKDQVIEKEPSLEINKIDKKSSIKIPSIKNVKPLKTKKTDLKNNEIKKIIQKKTIKENTEISKTNFEYIKKESTNKELIQKDKITESDFSYKKENQQSIFLDKLDINKKKGKAIEQERKRIEDLKNIQKEIFDNKNLNTEKLDSINEEAKAKIKKLKDEKVTIKDYQIHVEKENKAKEEKNSKNKKAFEKLNDDLFKDKLSVSKGNVTDKEKRRIEAMTKLQDELFNKRPTKKAIKEKVNTKNPFEENPIENKKEIIAEKKEVIKENEIVQEKIFTSSSIKEIPKKTETNKPKTESVFDKIERIKAKIKADKENFSSLKEEETNKIDSILNTRTAKKDDSIASKKEKIEKKKHSIFEIEETIGTDKKANSYKETKEDYSKKKVNKEELKNPLETKDLKIKIEKSDLLKEQNEKKKHSIFDLDEIEDSIDNSIEDEDLSSNKDLETKTQIQPIFKETDKKKDPINRNTETKNTNKIFDYDSKPKQTKKVEKIESKDENLVNQYSKEIKATKEKVVLRKTKEEIKPIEQKPNFLNWLKKKQTLETQGINIEVPKIKGKTITEKEVQIQKEEIEEIPFDKVSNIEAEMHHEIKASTDPLDTFISHEIAKKKTVKHKVTTKTEKRNQSKKSGLVSETLAEIMIAQKNYNGAIEVYEILITKYPEKSTYFARQIEKIKTYL